jgi:hypothetical protein
VKEVKHYEQIIHVSEVEIEIKEVEEPLFYGINSAESSTLFLSIHIRHGIHILSLYIKKFPKPLHPSHFQRFIEKFLTDLEYRKQYLYSGYKNWEQTVSVRNEQGVYFQCKELITTLNQKENLQFKDLTKLHSFGKDIISSMKMEELETFIPSSVIQLVNEKLNEQWLIIESLRWIARGLKPTHAIYKVIADKEIKENKKMSKK